MDQEIRKLHQGIVILAIWLIILMLCIEGLSIQLFEGHRTLFQIIHVVLLILLISSLFLLKVITGKKLQMESSALSKERMELQRAGENTAARYKNLLEFAGDAIFVINAETGQLEDMNCKGVELFGYSREEMERLNGRDLVPLQYQETYISLVKRIIRHGMANEECIRFRRKDGGLFLGEVNARFIDLGSDKVVQVIVRDITQKKQAEEDIRAKNKRLSILNYLISRIGNSMDLNTVLNMTLHQTMDMLSAEGGVVHLVENGALTVVAQKSSVDHKMPLLASIDHSCPMALSRKCQSLTESSETECRISSAARENGWQSAAGIPLVGGKQLIGVMHILSRSEREYLADDIEFLNTLGNQIGIGIEHSKMFEELKIKSDELLRSHRLLERNSHQLELSQKRLTKNLELVEQANRDMERVNSMKNHFIGMISHEFKTPLTSIMSGTEFLMANHLRAEKGEIMQVAEMIHSSGTRLDEIISQLLKVARIETGNQAINSSVIHLHDILTYVKEGFETTLEERCHLVVLEGVDSVPLFYGDREFLVEIFTQLMGNAVKFTPDGGEICISVRIINDMMLIEKAHIINRFNPVFIDGMGCRYYVQVEIRDTGIGVEFNEQLNIFDKFYELGDICHHSTGKLKFQGKGTGVGLAIVKGMVEAHGGMIWVESPVVNDHQNPGSSFFLLLPLEEESDQSAFTFRELDECPPDSQD
jgi:PAS domain S-box-containing protein